MARRGGRPRAGETTLPINDTPWEGAVVLLVAFVCGIVWLHRARKTWRTRPRPAQLALLLVAVSGTLLVLELYFAFFYVASDAGSYTLSNQKWLKKYWHPINELGYRDREYRPEDFLGKKVVFVTGDSFVAGTGIEHVEDRFPDLMQARLGPDYVVVNIAKTNWSTEDEHRALVEFTRRFRVSPDVVVLSYYINDIRRTAMDLGHPPLIRGAQPALVFLARKSNLLDFAFWRLYRLSKIFDEFWVYVENAYADETIWNAHARRLDEVVGFAERHDARLVVVAFPSLVKMDFCKPITRKVCDHFRQRGVECLDLVEDLEPWEVGDLIVSRADPHPGKKLHRYVGGLLSERILEGAASLPPERGGAPPDP